MTYSGERSPWSTVFDFTTAASGITPISSETPDKYSVSQNYPNPFNSSTHFELRIPNRGLVTLRVFDALGHETATLINEYLQPGTYEVGFEGIGYSSGVYYYQLETESFTETKRMLLVK